jgi:hypothetical protein
MNSCDFVLTAIKLSKYDIAKKLCEILFIADKNKFALLYGLVNIALKNFYIARTVCESNSFKLGLVSALQSQNWYGNLVEVLDSDEIIKKIQSEIDNESNLMQRLFSGNCVQII